MRSGKCDYDFVEVMACPSGCLNGGGQLSNNAAHPTTSDSLLKSVIARHEERYVPSTDAETDDDIVLSIARNPHQISSPSAAAATSSLRRGEFAATLWQQWHNQRNNDTTTLNDDSNDNQRLSLRTTYEVRTAVMSNPLSIKW